MINNGRVSFLSAPGLDGLLEGGVPVVVDGHYVGAVGVSGVKSSEDVQIAKAGIACPGPVIFPRRQACACWPRLWALPAVCTHFGASMATFGDLRFAGGRLLRYN
jgi:hypothetical protein